MIRLLNASTYRFEEFHTQIPPYAILSHTWGNDEVLYQDLLKGFSAVATRKGFSKIKGCCAQARSVGFEWVWIDTCCIDKTSSAEMSDAINSMYRWYRDAGVCYVHLADVPRFRLTDSVWFERGWTLQELIAPKYVEFYTSDWIEIGTKSSLESTISAATGISVEVLRGQSPRTCTVAERLSWAAGRQTTRLEDEAYCLFGILDINMPVIYGEGQRAFERLQQEILRQSEDFSILAWSPWVGRHPIGSSPSGVLAQSPAAFKRTDLTSYLPATTFGFDDAESMLFADMGSLDWKDLEPHKWNSKSNLLPLHQFLFDPPTITSRGISATLPIDLSEPDEASDRAPSRGGTKDVLAWVYTDVSPTRLASNTSRASSRNSSRTSRQSITDHGMMICIWLTITFNNLEDHETPLRAVRTPGKGPVCVPMIFLHRFQPRHMYLQYAPERQAPQPPRRRTSLGYEPSARALNIALNECPKSARRVKIVSHYPQKAVFQRPIAESRDPTTDAIIPGKIGAVWSASKDRFTVVMSSGETIDAAGALRIALKYPESGETSAQFVVLFAHPHPHDSFRCYLEPVEETDLEGEEQHFWSNFLSRRRRTSNDVLPQASDRSSLVLPCGMSVKAAIRKQGIGPLGTFIPTLTLSTLTDKHSLATMDQLLSIID
ncbi:hypothetical protein jhhlp_004434 [Lomentospora prolificans]|uniref:Uncharacterized protein n=1 Tax=Lomentospora prolificans TaxID=41688 RepID=A0A2N3NBL6_9PEZI|nr:hypothetical protein jhhlp_004434 [Lomentospora prolificans]